MIVLFCMLIGLAQADEKIVTLEAGNPAPFTGTLLSPDATARLLADSESAISTCLAEAEKTRKQLETDHQFILESRSAELAACHMRSTELDQLYLNHVEYLEKRVTQPEWHKPVFFAGGVLTGIAVVMASAWAIDRVGD